MAIQPFQWGSGGQQITSPQQAARQRAIAEALIGQVGTANNWAEGLADVTGNLTGSILNNRAGEAETAGQASVAELLSGLGSQSPEQDIIAALSNPWASPQQASVASALLGQQFKVANDALNVAEDPSSVREWEYFNALTPDQQSQYLVMKRSVPYLDVGTGYVQPDPASPGQPNGPEIVKDNYTPAYDAGSGKADAATDAETKAAFDSLNSKLPGIRRVVDELGVLADKATYTTAGKLWDDVVRETGALPTEGAVARTKYQAMVDNQVLPLLRDTFGAAFTVQEGESLRATLGAPDKSPKEKRAVLEAFIEQKTRDLEALQSRLPGASSAPSGGVWNDVPGMPGVKIRAK